MWSPSSTIFFGFRFSSRAVELSGVQPHSSTTTVCTWSGFFTFSSHSLSSLDVLAIVQSII